MSALNLRDRDQQWRTELCPNGLNEEVEVPEGAIDEIGPNVNGRTAPAMLDKDTMFYSYADFVSDVSASCIWRATAVGEFPYKEWTEDDEPVYCTTVDELLEDEAPFVIDPSAFYDAQGKPWITFGSHFSGIFLLELDENDTGRVKEDSEPVLLARGRWSDEADDLDIEEFSVIEAPYMHYNSDNEFYYLFVNWGTCCSGTDSTYNIRVGRSRSVTGPFLDKRGRNMLDRKGSIVLPRRPRKEPRINGPGHAGIVSIGNKEYFSFHFYDR